MAATELVLQGKTAVRWRIFLLILVIITINYIDRASLSVAMPAIGKEFGLNETTQGIIFSAFFWSYALMQVPGGWLADRYRPRRIIAASTILWGAFQALASLTTGPLGLGLARFGLGLAEGPVYPASSKLNAIWLPARERGRGAVLMDGGAPLGMAFGGLIVATLIGAFDSWRTAFVIAGVGTVGAGMFSYWYIRDDPRDQPSANAAEVQYIESEHAMEDQFLTAAPAGPTNVFDFFRFRSFWGMLLGWLGFDVIFYGLVTWAPTYLSQARHLSLAAVGGTTFTIFGAGFVGELIGGFLADHWTGRGGSHNLVMRTILGISGVMATASTFFLAFVSSPVTAVALLATTLFFLRWAGLYWSIPATLTDRARAGVVGGIMNFVGNVGGILVPIIVGVLVHRTGSYFLALMFFAAAGVMYFTGSMMVDYSRRLPI